MNLKIIARIVAQFPTKYAIPRQSNLVPSLRSTIIFEPEYRNDDALKGLQAFSHLWLIWGFSQNIRDEWSPTVRPPRLGGNTRMGVFATRSSFRPNPIALSSVKLDSLEKTPNAGTVVHVLGADLMDGTPIYDIKPYLSFTDSHPDATNGFAGTVKDKALQVIIPDHIRAGLDDVFCATLCDVLAQDPRPAYQHDPDRIYGFPFDKYEIRFKVIDDTLVVTEIIPG